MSRRPPVCYMRDRPSGRQARARILARKLDVAAWRAYERSLYCDAYWRLDYAGFIRRWGT